MLNHVEIALLYIYAGILGAGVVSFAACWLVNEFVFSPIERLLTRQERKEATRKRHIHLADSELLNEFIRDLVIFPQWDGWEYEDRYGELKRRGVL